MIETLYWRESLWLTLIALPLLGAFWQRWRQARQWQQIAEPAFLPWLRLPAQAQDRWQTYWAAIAILFFAIALAGPRTPVAIPENLQQPTSDIVFLVDLSASMQVQEAGGTRIEQAQRQLQDWLASPPPGAKIGLVVFAGSAHVLLPPTSDRVLLQHFSEHLRELRLPFHGNALNAGIRKAQSLFAETGRARHLVVLSDGDMPTLTLDTFKPQTPSPSSPAIWHWVGVGSDDARNIAAAIAQSFANPSNSRSKAKISSRRHAEHLQTLATRSGGIYSPLETLKETPLDAWLELPALDLSAHASDIQWQEHFVWPLLIAIIAWLIALLPPPWRKSVSRVLLIGGLLSVGGGLGACSPQTPNANTAEQAIADGDWALARTQAKAIGGYEGWFLEGIACYRARDYVCANEAFSQAAWHTEHREQRAAAVFNLANSVYRQGDYAQAIVLFEDAQKWGLDSALVDTNLAYARAMQAAVRRHHRDQIEGLRRASWRVAAGQMPAATLGRLADNIALDLSTLDLTDPALAPLAALDPRSLREQLERGLSFGKQPFDNSESGRWIATESSDQAHGTAALLNRLFARETGLQSLPKVPRSLIGERAW